MLSETSRSDTLLFWPLERQSSSYSQRFTKSILFKRRKFPRENSQADGFVTWTFKHNQCSSQQRCQLLLMADWPKFLCCEWHQLLTEFIVFVKHLTNQKFWSLLSKFRGQGIWHKREVQWFWRCWFSAGILHHLHLFACSLENHPGHCCSLLESEMIDHYPTTKYTANVNLI